MSSRSAFAVVLLVGVGARAARAERPEMRVDVEPVAYVLRGYSVHLRMALPPAPRNVVGVGAYGYDVPAVMNDLAAGNRGEDWEVRLLVGYNVFVDRFVGASARDGWVVGAQVGVQHFRARLGDGEARFANLLVMARGGYEWHPRGVGFYLFPWLGVAGAATIAGETRAGDEDFTVSPVVPYGAVELGWRW